MDTVRIILLIIVMMCALLDAFLAAVFLRWAKENRDKKLGEVYPQLKSILTVFFALIVCMVLIFAAFIAAKIYV